jgi:hypothetical protein
MRPLLLLSLAGALMAGEVLHRDVLRNPLRQQWPHELVRRDLPAAVAARIAAVTVGGGEMRPVQVASTPNADGTVGCWFIASLQGGTATDAKGRGRRDPAPAELPLEFHGPAAATGAISRQRDDEFLIIDAGCYTLRLRHFAAGLPTPVPLAQAPHFLGGVGLPCVAGLDGIASFTGDATVVGIDAEIVADGPVFVELRYTYRFADAEADGTAPAPELAAGKRSHRWPTPVPPVTAVPKRPRHYEALVRCVVGDPWIEVVERYRLPADHGWRLTFGNRPDWGLDTARWPRWFEYDRFGGNNRLLAFPLTPRPEQQGRPFAHLQPVWTQRGAHSQDCWVTAGGTAGEGDATTQPCLGLVAAHASKWVNPAAQVIRIQVADGRRAEGGFPLTDGGGTGFHYGQRAWALCAGTRADFIDTGKVNDFVRRHNDWTLDAVANDQVLVWERAPATAGPVLLTTRARLDDLRARWADRAARPDDPEIRALAAAIADRDALAARRDAAQGRERQNLDRALAHRGWRLLDQITGTGKVRPANPPDAGLWLSTRYSDDFLNPTSPPTRRLKDAWIEADLARGDGPLGGPAQAALAYVFADPDHWPGWLQGWHPGNPNFHTDKYQVLAYTAACLPDHPHAGRWLDHALALLREDLDRTLLPPDGVGYECPGYSGYSLGHQLDLARIFHHAGRGNLVATDPRFRATGDWHRRLLTPPDPRLGGRRHEAPHGDTHRWFAGCGDGFADLAAFLSQDDPAAAADLLAAHALATTAEQRGGAEAVLRLVHGAHRVAPAAPDALDWSTKAYAGFGAILRSRFGTPRETFCSIKAGRMRGHYHNDELAFHFYGDGVPLALDYNCSYHPRGDHAALHNSMTFGVAGTLQHHDRNQAVEALEQLHGTATVSHFTAGADLDTIVAERADDGLQLAPVDPRDAEFSRSYPRRTTGRISHRRTLTLVKHAADSPLADYLAVRDETTGTEPGQLNLHLLARSAAVDGAVIRCPGQGTRDALVVLAHAPDARVEVRSWHYGEDDGAPGDGRDLIPPPGHTGPWWKGEYQVWLRVHLPPAASATWVLYPQVPGQPEPAVSAADDGRTVTVTRNGVTETIRFTATGATLDR